MQTEGGHNVEKLINLPKWCKRPEESIELYLGDVAHDTESDTIKLYRGAPNMLIAGYAGSGKLPCCGKC